MRFLPILLVIFSYNTIASATPARAALLEVRGVLVMPDKPKHVRRLLRKAVDGFRGKKENTWPIGSNVPLDPNTVGTRFIQYIVISIVPIMLTSAFYSMELGVVMTGATVFGSLGVVAVTAIMFGNDPHTKLAGRQVYFTKMDGDSVELCRGCVSKKYADDKYQQVLVETTEGSKERVALKDIGGVALPDHPDLHRRVLLPTKAEDTDYMRLIGKVSEVYSDGSYEIEVDHKADYQLNEFPVDEPLTIFMHASLSEHEEGFTFIGDGKVNEHNETTRLTTAAQQTDSTAQEDNGDERRVRE